MPYRNYYPYGKTLREFTNGDGPEKFLTTQHERDVETGLDYRGARFYDADVARFLSLDPLAADYPEWSDYSYVMGNPVHFIDPSGMAVEDYYSVDDKGHIKLERKTNDEYDVLYKRDNGGQIVSGSVIKVNNKLILPALSQIEKGAPGEYVRFGKTLNDKVAFKVFNYLANNTSVEWSLNAFNLKNGSTAYVIGTFNETDVSPREVRGHNILDLKFAIHSHPGWYNNDGTKNGGAKGASGGDDFNSGNPRPKGDMGGIIRTNDNFEAKNKKLPPHYVYNIHSKSIYQFTPMNPSIFIKKVESYQDLFILE